jgi:copper homeostasis protein (lipoprotein)
MSSIRMRAIGLLPLFALLGACAREPGPARPEPDAIGREAVTYQGDIPCADCPGQRLTLTLFADRTFRLRHTYLGRDQTFHELGRWGRAPDAGDRLTLARGSEAPRQFAILGANTLRMLDNEGREIRSALNYYLKRQSLLDPVAGPMRLRGMYVYMADAATFSECLTGKRFPVLSGKDHLALERAYLAARAPGNLLAAVIDGRFVHHAPEPGATVREHVVVERFDRVLPGETCAPQAHAKASLLETYWRPVEIEGQAVVVHAGTREPHFVLSREGNRVRGLTGCNSLAGGFKQGADGFRFTQLISTRMACLPANDLEGSFLSALQATASQRIIGDSLELRDQEGRMRMRLEARYLR